MIVGQDPSAIGSKPQNSQSQQTDLTPDPFGSVYRSVLCDRRLTPSAKLIMADLCTYRNHQSELAWPSVKTLMADLGLVRSSVQRGLALLRELGYLIDTGRRTKRGVVVYRIVSSLQGGSAPIHTISNGNVQRTEGAAPVRRVAQNRGRADAAPIRTEPKIDNTTTNPALPPAKVESIPDPEPGETGGGSLSQFELPKQVSDQDARAIRRMLTTVPAKDRESVISEFSMKIVNGHVQNPCGYFRGILRHYREGSFTATAVQKQQATQAAEQIIQEQRQAEREREQAREAAQAAHERKIIQLQGRLPAGELQELEHRFVTEVIANNTILKRLHRSNGMDSKFVRGAFEAFLLREVGESA